MKTPAWFKRIDLGDWLVLGGLMMVFAGFWIAINIQVALIVLGGIVIYFGLHISGQRG